jgi:hypothetical protein
MSKDLTPERVPEPLKTGQVRISGRAEVVRDRIIERHSGLWAHNPNAVNVAAEALVAFTEVANGHLASVRCDRSERVRQMQADGTTGWQSEDIVATAHENEYGKDAVIAWAQVVLSSIGWRAVPNDAPDAPGALLIATAAVARDGGEFFGLIAEAQADGRIDTNENDKIQKQAHRIAQNVQVAARVAANEEAKGRL